jgi:plastocyanin
MRILLAVTSIIASAIALVNASTRNAAATASDEASIAIRTFQFAPDTVRVRAGTRVLWSNNDDIEHTITSGTADDTKGPFHGVVAKSGATYSAMLNEPGTYRYFCDRHRFMNGTVIVTR